MTTILPDATVYLSDGQLIVEVKAAASREREATTRLIALLAELDARRLYLGQGCSSLFTYCTHVLRLSEHAAYGRIAAARAARTFPAILDHLTDGSLTLTAVTLLAPHLTPENHLEILDAARHQGKRAIEAIRALTLLLSDLEKGRLAAAARSRTTRAPTEGSRHIPAAVRRTVWARDGGQCAFVGAEGRCPERGFLEFHHIRPHALGGAAVAENIALRCRAHNLHEAEEYFGRHLPLLVRERQPRYGRSSVWTEFVALRQPLRNDGRYASPSNA